MFIIVAFGTLEDCRDHNHVVLKSQTGYLSTLMTEETGYGLAGCPWRIKAQPGQNLELSVMDFNLLAHFQTRGDPYDEDYLGWCPVSIVIGRRRCGEEGHCFVWRRSTQREASLFIQVQ